MNGAQSRLHIAGATYSDSGNYTCMMGRTATAVIELQIIPGIYIDQTALEAFLTYALACKAASKASLVIKLVDSKIILSKSGLT